MAHGTRGRWVRVAATGFGVLLCTGLIGCMNSDKPKDLKQTKAPTGLPGTPTLAPNGGAMTKTGQPPLNGVGANGQPNNILSPTGVNATPTRFASTGNNTLNTGGNIQPVNYTAGQQPFLGAPAQTGIQPPSGTQNTNWGGSHPGAFNTPAPPIEPVPPLPPPVVTPPSTSESFSPAGVPPQYAPMYPTRP